MERLRRDREQPDRQERDVVTSLAGTDQLLQQVLDELLRLPRAVENGRPEPFEPFVDRLAAPLDEAVRIEDERRPDRELDDLLRISRVGPGAEWQAPSALQELDPAIRKQRPGAVDGRPTSTGRPERPRR